MSKTVLPAPLDSPAYWRRLLATCHPDKPDGDHDLFLFLTGLKEHVEGCRGLSDRTDRTHQDRGGAARRDRIPFDPGVDFEERTLAILRWYRDAPDPWRRVLTTLVDCGAADHGRDELKQRRGATWKQAGYVAHLAGFSDSERREWYRICREIPLSERHASHLIGRLMDGSNGRGWGS